MIFKLKINNLAILSQLFILLFLVSPVMAEDVKVVELFTSKYCPACPAADRNFNALVSSNPEIIALSCHVTYFNRAKRSDLLSSAFCDGRQNTYKSTLNTGGVYTPMTIINGQLATTGIENDALKRSIQNSAALNKIALRKNGEYLDIRTPQISLEKDADLWLIEYKEHATQKSYTHYRNPITNITKLLKWNGSSMTMAFPINSNKSYAVLAQTNKDGIIAAGKAD